MDVCDCESYDCSGECCGIGNCTCTPDARSDAELYASIDANLSAAIDAEIGAGPGSTSPEPEINWTLIEELAVKPHPTLNSDHSCDCHNHCGEIVEEARAVSHLLDMAGVAPGTRVYDRYIDARVYLLVTEVLALRDRLSRIATWHSRERADGGLIGDYCTECGNLHPCETRRMADGSHEDLKPDPAGEAAHGLRELESPGAGAQRVMQKIQRGQS